MKHIVRLYMLITGVLATVCILQRKDLKDLNKKFDYQCKLRDIQTTLVECSTRSIEVVRCWHKDKKIDLAMLKEYFDAINVDDETKAKIENL